MAKPNLSFYGSSCTRDCSGHDAGWKWRKNNPNAIVQSSSPSFISGTAIRDLQTLQGKNLIGTVARNMLTGKFQKIVKGK